LQDINNRLVSIAASIGVEPPGRIRRMKTGRPPVFDFLSEEQKPVCDFSRPGRMKGDSWKGIALRGKKHRVLRKSTMASRPF
jgi:hypothetical protein